MSQINPLSKLPPAVQVLLGFAVIALGLYDAVFAVLWSGGDIRMQYIFCSIAVIMMLIGVTPTIEGILTINAAIEKCKSESPKEE